MRLFHTTDKANLPSIRRSGLLRSFSTAWKNAGGIIYLSTSAFRPDERAVLLADVDGLEITRLSEWEYACWEDIPSERITFLGSGLVRCGLCGAIHIAAFSEPIAIPLECHKCRQMSCYFVDDGDTFPPEE